MENSQEKMHLMISLKALEVKAKEVYHRSVEKYDFRLVKTANDALNNNAPRLAAMRKTNPALADKVLQYMIAAAANSFNLVRNIEPEQIQCLVEDLQSEFFYLKLSEIYFVLREARMGRIEKTYERLDQPTIMKWFENYVDTRLTIAAKQSEAMHDSKTHNEKSRKYDGFVANLYTDQQKEKQQKIMNIAYGMAKKMVKNEPEPKTVMPPSEPNNTQSSEN